MKESKGILGLFLFIADIVFLAVIAVYYMDIAGPAGHTIDSSFLRGVRTSAILGAMCEAIPYLFIISVIISVIYFRSYVKGEVSNTTRYAGTAFLIGSLIICLVLPMNFYTGEASVRAASATGRFEDTKVSALRIILEVVSSAEDGRRGIGRRYPFKVTTEEYYIKFDGGKCPASSEEYNKCREGMDFYIVSFGNEDFECFNAEDYMLP